MSQLMWIRSHVELLLQREWDVCRVLSDEDGDFPYRHGTAACYVSVLDVDPPMVRVFAHAAYGLKRDVVVVSQTVSPIGLTQPVLAQAMDAVGSVADDIGTLLAAMFDGATPFKHEIPDSEEAS
jgi:hypothetical protein